MTAELRRMDDVAGGGDVLSLARHHFSWVAGLLDQASYDDAADRKLHTALAELGQLVGGSATTPVSTSWRSATTSLPCGLLTRPMTGHSAPTSCAQWPTKPPAKGDPSRP